MDDIRKINYSKKLKRRANFSTFIRFFIKNWIKLILFIIIMLFLFYPNIVGSIVGEWFNELVTSFISKLTF
jgi:hypothetical protein